MARISLDKSKTLDAAAKAGIVGLKCLAAASQVTLSTLTRMLTRDRGASRPYVIAVVRTLYPKDPRSMDELMAELDGRSIASEPPTPTHGELVDMACQVGKAIADCDRVLRTLGQSADAESQVHVGAALGEKGVIAGALGDVEAEFAAYDEIVARFEKSEVATLQHLVGWECPGSC